MNEQISKADWMQLSGTEKLRILQADKAPLHPAHRYYSTVSVDRAKEITTDRLIDAGA